MKQGIYKKIMGTFLLAMCCTGGSLCSCAKNAEVEFVTVEELESLIDAPDTAMDFSHESMERKVVESVAIVEANEDADGATQTPETTQTEEIVVHVCGAVCNPGVYSLKPESRVIDAVMVAGGMAEDADSECVNLASKICDGDKVRIPTKAETEQLQNAGKQVDCITSSNAKKSEMQEETGDKININTADTELLCTLPGIGKTRAAGIIAYREESGGFSIIEDIMKVSGIKESSFQKIKDYITVN